MKDVNNGFWRFVILVAGVGLIGIANLQAQVVTGQLTGRTTDPSGAVVPGVQVNVLNSDTGLERTTSTNEEGYYTVPLLPPGMYQISVRKEGFRPVTRTGITLQVDQIARIDFAFQVGAVSEVVEVHGSAGLVETESAAMGSVVQRETLLDLPLSQRDTFALTLLSPGVQPPVGGVLGTRFDSTYSFSVNGGRPQSSEVMLDGVTDTTPGAFAQNFAAITPPPDAVEEFKIQTSNYAAEFGRSGGGIVNVVMRSGNNVFHGSAHEFLQNKVLDATNFFSNRAGVPIGQFKRSQFGGTFGGPIKKNKLFFFTSWESLREGADQNRTDTVPTARERLGDFSASFQSVGGVCTPVQIYDPTTTLANSSGSGYIRSPFPGNVIPPSRLDPVGAKAASYYPLPNVPGVSCSGANNRYADGVNKFSTNETDSKGDWVPTDKDHVFLAMSYFGALRNQADLYGTAADTNGRNIGPDSYPAKSARADYTRVVSPTFLLDFRGGAVRWGRTTPPFPANWNMTNLGFPQNLQAQMNQPVAFPLFTITGYSNLGYYSPYIFQDGTLYQMIGNATWIRGKHNIKFGGEHRIQQDFEDTGFWTAGNYTFDRTFTQGPNPNTAAANLGNAIAGLLLGTGTGLVTKNPGAFTSNHYTGVFIQDNIKLTAKLTLDIGLRYELETPRKERNNKLSYWVNSPSPLATEVPSLPNLSGGLAFVGPASNYAQFDTDYNNFAPRLGLAYAVLPKTVIRTGYGISYSQFVGMAVGTGDGQNGFLANTNWTGSLNGNLTPFNYLSNAFPNGLTVPTGSSLGLLTNIGTDLTATRDGPVFRNSRVGYVQLWNFNIQHELKGILLEVGYNGNKGTKLLTNPGWEMNQLPTQDLARGTALQQLVPNPFYGTIGTGQLAQPTIALGQLLRPYPQFLSMVTWYPAADSTIYHAFQFRAQKDFSQGIGFLVAYTHSKLIDDVGPFQDAYNRAAARSLSTLDCPDRFVSSITFALPVGRNKRFGANWPKVLNGVAGGWQTNAIVTLSSGWPLGMTASNVAGLFNATELPNLVGDPSLPSGRTTTAQLAGWFNTAAFKQPAAFTLGNSARTLNIRSDGIENVDFSVFKEFPFGEQRRAEFRGEFFNFLNTPQFAAPGTTVGTGSFGVVSAMANSPRVAQLALKLRF